MYANTHRQTSRELGPVSSGFSRHHLSSQGAKKHILQKKQERTHTVSADVEHCLVFHFPVPRLTLAAEAHRSVEAGGVVSA